ncbi:hypothetical protein [Streptomyces pactum]|uniref:Uncharacterized protein n=1 Tax=Streptomyces pactum TaxID=68249 RepID=A0A1S6J2E6_9ACTN|nr:hypothetical protein B1H29_02315 [Streptomyces pactum]
MMYMTTTPQHPAPARWAVRAAHTTALLTLPTGIWRLLLAAGQPAGYTDAGYEAMGIAGWGVVYVVGLSVVSEALALLTLGLVRPWGEVVPRWIPLVGGRPVPVLAAVLPAGLGAVVLTALWTPFAWWWATPHPDMTPLGDTLLGFAYLPLIAWGPLLGAVTVSYYRRRRPAPAGAARTPITGR